MKIIKLFPENSSEVIAEIASALRKGKVIVIPSDTVYGLAADAGNAEAVRRIFEIKKRLEKKILPLFISSLEMAERIWPIKDEKVKKILEKLWPGKLTAVLKSRHDPALRFPNNKFVSDLIDAFGGPIAETSANISGASPHTNIAEVLQEFEANDLRPDLVVDAGDLPESLPSTVVDFTQTPPKILREGAVSREELNKVFGCGIKNAYARQRNRKINPRRNRTAEAGN